MTVWIDDCQNGPARLHRWDAAGICEACHQQMPDNQTQFAQRLESLLNRHSMENESNTPDFLLAQYLLSCLKVWNETSRARERWYGKSLRIGGEDSV